MCAPLKTKDEVLGVLYVDNLTRPGTFSADDLEFLSAFANQAAAAIHNALLHAKLEREAVRRNNLKRFFPPSVVGSLMSGEGTPGDLVERNVTAVFADICDYTRISSSLPPSEVLALLNQYLPAVAGAVFAREGTLEKYIGDALLAVWGAPFEKPDDSDRALQAAIDMQVAIARLAGQWAGEVSVAIRVGLCTGPVAAGNIGTEEYLQYATIGGTTTLASRVCAAAEPGEILIAESTRRGLSQDGWTLEALPPITVKGKDEPMQLHRVLWRVEG
jgi:adenylate cyclase